MSDPLADAVSRPPEPGISLPGADFDAHLAAEIARNGGPLEENPDFAGAVGRTMFDTPASQDNTVTVLLPAEAIGALPAQALVRIKSRSADTGGDGRTYLGAVVEGPFAEPDGLRADAPIVVTTTVRGVQFLPRYHGRVQVEVMGEEVDGVLEPPRFRPLPNSPVFALDEAEMRAQLGLEHAAGIELGLAVGYESMPVQIPSNKKSVLPRHVGVLGTTGGGKSTTVSGLIAEFARSGMATVLFDTEGEYTEIGLPTADPTMLKLLARQKKEAHGVGPVHVRYLVGRSSTAPAGVTRTPFRLDFSALSPYAVGEILDFSEAQEDRFFKAYDAAKLLMRDMGIFPAAGNEAEERQLLDVNEFEVGWPRMTLSLLLDVANAINCRLSKTEFTPTYAALSLSDNRRQLDTRVNQIETSHPVSWRSLIARLTRLQRTNIFDNPAALSIPFGELVKPGQTTIIDLSDSDSTVINNLVIAGIMRGLQEQQEVAYARAEAAGTNPTPVMIVVEEAHEFLARERIAAMPTLFGQVARLARRGRKRWLGLVFVTQLPQHLPDELLGLVNNFILHKISDVNVVARLRKTIGAVDEGLWNRLPNLAPGQAIVSMTSMTRPMLVAIHPTPCKLRMVE